MKIKEIYVRIIICLYHLALYLGLIVSYANHSESQSFIIGMVPSTIALIALALYKKRDE